MSMPTYHELKGEAMYAMGTQWNDWSPLERSGFIMNNNLPDRLYSLNHLPWSELPGHLQTILCSAYMEALA